MTFDSFMLFLHIVGALTLFIAFGLEWESLNRLRAATTFEEIRKVNNLTARNLPLNVFAILAVLVPGIYLAARMRVWDQGWIEVAMPAVFLMPILGGALTGRRMRAIRQASAHGTGPAPDDLRHRLRDILLVASVQIRIALVIGIVFLMVNKPELSTSVAGIGTAIAAGVVWAVATAWRQASPWTRNADAENESARQGA